MKNGIIEFSEKEKEELKRLTLKYKTHLCSVIYSQKQDCENCPADRTIPNFCILDDFVRFLNKGGKK